MNPNGWNIEFNTIYMGRLARAVQASYEAAPDLGPEDLAYQMEPLACLRNLQASLGLELLEWPMTVAECREVKQQLVDALEGLLEEGPTPEAVQKVSNFTFALGNATHSGFEGPLLDFGPEAALGFEQHLRALQEKVPGLYEPKWINYNR